MSDTLERIEVFQDTMNWISQDPVLSASIVKAKKNTKVYYEDDYPFFDASRTCDTIIEVTKERSFESAMRLSEEQTGSKIAVMNFANAFHAGGGACMNKAELFGYHVKRAIHMLTCAAAEGADILVLGAFGCGAFENDPAVVARAYKTALREFPNVFKKIVFAIYCPPGRSTNYDLFKKNLAETEDESN